MFGVARASLAINSGFGDRRRVIYWLQGKIALCGVRPDEAGVPRWRCAILYLVLNILTHMHIRRYIQSASDEETLHLLLQISYCHHFSLTKSYTDFCTV